MARIDQWWRAANYLSVGQIYLLDNPLLREPLTRDHVKPRLLGHWGTTPGLNFLYAHLNRAIAEREQSTIYVTGPGHGGPGLVASAYLDGTYSEFYSDITEDVEGIHRLFRQFSFPGGIPSHVAPETPGSIHEGGELGYALSHAYGAAFDNPDLLVATVIGDGEAETGPLATSWHSNKFVNAENDGVVLPILHLNGYKIANPTVLARIPDDELRVAHGGLRAQAAHVRRGVRRRVARGHPPPVRDAARRGARRDRRDQAQRARRQRAAPAVADDRLPHPQGLDRPGLHRRQEDHRLVAGAPGAAGQRPGHPRAPRRAARSGSSRTASNELFDESGRLHDDIRALAPSGPPADERQPARQRRHAAQGPAPAGLPRVRGGRAGAGRLD